MTAFNMTREHQTWTVNQWNLVILCDESRCYISFGYRGICLWKKFPQSLIAWGRMSTVCVRKICFLKRLINAAVYREALDHFLIPYIKRKFGNNEFIFQHGLALLSTEESTKEWFREKTISVLDRPEDSLGANPKENLWGIFKRKPRKDYPL